MLIDRIYFLSATCVLCGICLLGYWMKTTQVIGAQMAVQELTGFGKLAASV